MSEAPLPETKPPVPRATAAGGLPNVDLNSLISQALPSGSTAHIKPTIDRLGQIQTEKNAAMDPVRRETTDRMNENRAEVRAKYDAIEPVDIQPWTQKRPPNDPAASFGSFGSVFAQLASAFTNQPMINALEGSAAAMKAFRANEIAEYEDGFDVWQENTKVALKRHDAQQEEYRAALKLMDTDMAAGQAQLTMLATKYGDDAMAEMNKAGLYKEMNQVMEGRQRAALGVLQAYPRLLEEGIQAQGYLSDPDAQSQDPAKRAAAYQRWFSPLRSLGGAGSFLNQERQLLFQKLKQDFIQKNGRPPSITEESEMIDKVYSMGTARGAKDLEAQKVNASLVKEIDTLIKMVETNPKIVGSRGILEKGKEAVAGMIDPTVNYETPRAEFASKLTSARQRVSAAMTNSKYYSALRQEEMKTILPGLESLTSPAEALNTLKAVREQLAGAETETGAEQPGVPPQPPPGFTEPVTNKAGKKGWKNPATGKVWVQP